jgi:hypothetical protein
MRILGMISILIVRFPESSVRAPRSKTLKRISDSDRRGEEEYQCRPRHSRGRHFGVRPEKFGAPFWSDGKLPDEEGAETGEPTKGAIT